MRSRMFQLMPQLFVVDVDVSGRGNAIDNQFCLHIVGGRSSGLRMVTNLRLPLWDRRLAARERTSAPADVHLIARPAIRYGKRGASPALDHLAAQQSF